MTVVIDILATWFAYFCLAAVVLYYGIGLRHVIVMAWIRLKIQMWSVRTRCSLIRYCGIRTGLRRMSPAQQCSEIARAVRARKGDQE